jgi:hypothetical protein
VKTINRPRNKEERLSSTGWLFGFGVRSMIFRFSFKVLFLDELHCSDRANKKYTWDAQSVDSYPSDSEDRIRNGLISSGGTHRCSPRLRVYFDFKLFVIGYFISYLITE